MNIIVHVMTARGKYHEYLESVFPATSWRSQDINGGCVNTTLRVVKTSGTATAESFILKHARPSFGEPGYIQEFSLKRQASFTSFQIVFQNTEVALTAEQEIERAALGLWDVGKPLYDRKEDESSRWRVPKCIRHDMGAESRLGLTENDSEASVLLIEDLGDVQDIMSYLEDCAKLPALPPNLEAHIFSAGQSLGTSLAKLHSQKTLAEIARHPSTMAVFSQFLTDHLVWSAMLDSLPEYLSSFEDGNELYQRVESDFKTAQYDYSLVLCHGDFHTGNVMVSSASASPAAPAVIDWEFAHLGRGVNDDAAKFTASIHCILIDARRGNKNETLANLLRRLVSGFCSGYRETAQRRYDAKNPDDANLQLLRSAMLFHGTEMIVFASEFIPDSAALQEILSVGAWYLRRSCADANAFAKQNLAVLALEEDERIMGSLFLN